MAYGVSVWMGGTGIGKTFSLQVWSELFILMPCVALIRAHKRVSMLACLFELDLTGSGSGVRIIKE